MSLKLKREGEKWKGHKLVFERRNEHMVYSLYTHARPGHRTLRGLDLQVGVVSLM